MKKKHPDHNSGLVGLASAGAVAGSIAIAGVFGVTAVASAPLWVAALITAGVGLGISYAVNQIWDMDKVKQDVADGFSTLPGIWENGKLIVSTGVERVEEAVNDTVDQVVGVAKDSARIVIDAVKAATDAITGLFGVDG